MKFLNKRNPVEALRTTVQRTFSETSPISSLPDRFEAIIARYESLNVDSSFKHDIYELLDSAVWLAQVLSDSTFSVVTAESAVARNLSVQGKVLQFLQARNQSQGFAVYMPEQRKLMGNFSTEGEAGSFLQSLRETAPHAYINCLVVPVQITSTYVTQPQQPAQMPVELVGDEEEAAQQPNPPAKRGLAAILHSADPNQPFTPAPPGQNQE